MGRKRSPGLVRRSIWQDGSRRGYVYHIDKTIGGQRVCESTGSSDLEEAERYLARRMEQIRQARIYGVRPSRTFAQAATKFLKENLHKRSIDADANRLKHLMPHIGDVPVDRLHMGVLADFIEHKRAQGRANGTINQYLAIVRRILNLAASEWIDEHGLTWIPHAPKIKLLPKLRSRHPYPLDWDEQERLFRELPKHLANMALFAINSGCRDGEICGLRWDWEVKVPELETSVFIVPGEEVKNGEDRLIVLNRIALSVIESVRGEDREFVFVHRGQPILRMFNTAWLRARQVAQLEKVRVHDLKHTYGRRLRAAGVMFEDRQDLLGHRSGRITTHYSAPELGRLIEASDRVCGTDRSRPALVVLRRAGR